MTSTKTRRKKYKEEFFVCREILHRVVIENKTLSGKIFDFFLLVCILISVLTITLHSVNALQVRFSKIFFVLEWIFTILFTIEYILRLITEKRPLRYMFSFFGLIDLLSIIPSYISLIFPAARFLVSLRILRALRIFRILKLTRYVKASHYILLALEQSRTKIFVFIYFVLLLAVIFGAIIYVIEGPSNGFTSIPRSIYWVIVTMSTVGYGDISPQTVPGQVLTTFIILCGYGIIAVPTGIVTAELTLPSHPSIKRRLPEKKCSVCALLKHDALAKFCHQCGGPLSVNQNKAKKI